MKLSIVMLVAMISSMALAGGKCGDRKSALKTLKENLRIETGLEIPQEDLPILVSEPVESENSMTFKIFESFGASGGVIREAIINKENCMYYNGTKEILLNPIR